MAVCVWQELAPGREHGEMREHAILTFPTLNGVMLSTVYRRRRPERTVLYQVIQENLETWLACREAADAEIGECRRGSTASYAATSSVGSWPTALPGRVVATTSW